jgi:autotransporter-associated beta strand protein
LIGGSGNGTVSGLIADWFDTTAGANRVVSVSKDGVGEWLFTGANTFTGTVAVTQGTLSVSLIDPTLTNAQPLGEASSAITLGTATTSGTLEYTGASATTLNRPITVNGVGGGIIKNSSSQTLTLGGTVTKNGRPLTLTGAGAFNVTGTVVGANANSDLVVDGTTVTLSSNGNTYNGATQVIDGGTLKNGIDNAVPSTSSIVTLGEAAHNSSGTYDLNGFNQTLTGLATAGTGAQVVTNGGASGTSTLTITGASTFGGVIQDGSTANVALTKSTTGILTLAGASTYTGETAVTSGTLVVSGSLRGTVDVAVNGGTLGGAGLIQTGNNGNVTVASGGCLAPGNSGAGTLSLALGTGQLDLSGAVGGSGWLKFELGLSSDEINLTSGSLNLGNSGLQLDDFSFTDAGGFGAGTYVLFATPGQIGGLLGANVSGTVLGLPATLELANGGNDLVLLVVPEPNTSAALIAGVASLLGLQRIRRRFRSDVAR